MYTCEFVLLYRILDILHSHILIIMKSSVLHIVILMTTLGSKGIIFILEILRRSLLSMNLLHQWNI
jgi:lipopolysaccharide/colanic/teichoic acid biosynthesis glycosyltransferase